MTSIALQAQGFATNITASDLPRSVKFYTEGLGFEIVQRYETEGTLRYVAMKGQSTANIGSLARMISRKDATG